MTRLDALYLERGQSPWVDNIRRDWLNDGTLATMVDRGVRGVTSNPSIFNAALQRSSEYDGAIAASSERDPEALFETLAVADVRDACDVLRSVYEASARECDAGVHRYRDGYVSLEVSPRLAHDTGATIDAAQRLWGRVDRPNLMVKIPATEAGLPAITATLAHGINVNVTLIFSLDRYAAVLEAYLAGVREARARGVDIEKLASVASFFVSRLDTAVDPLLASAASLRGTTALAQAACAFELFLERFRQDDALELLEGGAQIQRPLWASTSTKNPAYPDLLYVDPLVAAETVNTLPDATLAAFDDHGDLHAESIDSASVRSAHAERLRQVRALVDLDAVTTQLERDGVASFAAAYDELLQTIAAKSAR